MKSEYRKGSHTVTRMTCHLVWATKYRYQVLRGDVQVRCRELLIQICDAEGVEILKGVISSDHVHMHIEYAPKTSLSMLLKQMKGRTSRKLQQESQNYRKDIGENIFGLMDMVLGAQGI